MEDARLVSFGNIYEFVCDRFHSIICPEYDFVRMAGKLHLCELMQGVDS